MEGNWFICDVRNKRDGMRWRIKFLHPPARTFFLSMILLFPYFLCCPPSPPCRAALHAGACWPWRPTRYCQPTFHAPFCGLERFSYTKGCTLHERWPVPFISLPSPFRVTLRCRNSADNFIEIIEIGHMVQVPCKYLKPWFDDWSYFIVVFFNEGGKL